MIATVLLLAAVLAAAIPPLDAPESVIETLDSVRESVGELTHSVPTCSRSPARSSSGLKQESDISNA